MVLMHRLVLDLLAVDMLIVTFSTVKLLMY